MSWLTDRLDQTTYDKKIASIDKVVSSINREFSKYENEYNASKDDSFFAKKTDELRKKVDSLVKNSGIDENEALERILPEAYGLVKLAVKKVTNKTYYDVQLMGGILLNEGFISEMATGEGKTLTALLPVYLNAIMGKGAHVITPNDYLAKRDHDEVTPIFNLLGLSCGLASSKNDVMDNAGFKEEALKVLAKVKEMNLSPEERKKKENEEIDKLRSKYSSDNKQAYQADITYGSAHAFAFDYLRDTLNIDPEKRVTRYGDPNYVVIDEADAVLFDDALNSYRIAGDQKDKELGITLEQRAKMDKDIELCGEVMAYLMQTGLVAKVDNYRNHDAIPDDQHTHAVYYSESPRGFVASTILHAVAYGIFKQEELSGILQRNEMEIIRNLEQGDYFYKSGRLGLNPKGLHKLLLNGVCEELQASYDNFIFNEYPGIDMENAITAWFLLEKDLNYICSPNDKNPNLKSVMLVSDGRTQEGRQYAGGLQQAVEVKETYLSRGTKDKIVKSKINDTLASISVSSFYGRYSKFSGMTGTSCKKAFEHLYGRLTVKVPPNKPRNVKDLGDRLYLNRQEKYKAILEEVMTSVKKGQPILISTTSIEESERLQMYLSREIRNAILRDKELQMKRLRVGNIPILNARVGMLAQEADIISRAGKKGAITIATEMAGRGTDIKLGGEGASQQEREELLKLGGLKVIADGHFKYDRVDRQIMGRTGRQGNKGEYVCFNDMEDLERIGVGSKVIEKLRKLVRYNGKIDKVTKCYKLAVRDAQARNEGMTESTIDFNHKFSRPEDICRNDYDALKEKLLQTKDYDKFVEDAVDDVVKYMIYTACGEEELLRKTTNLRLKGLSLDKEVFLRDYRDTFGVNLPSTVFDRCNTTDDLISVLGKLGKEEISSVNPSVVNTHFNRVWFDFQDSIEQVKFQYNMDQIGRAGNSDLKYHVGIINSFTECYLGEMKEVCKKSARKNLERRGFQEIPELSSKHR